MHDLFDLWGKYYFEERGRMAVGLDDAFVSRRLGGKRGLGGGVGWDEIDGESSIGEGREDGRTEGAK